MKRNRHFDMGAWTSDIAGIFIFFTRLPVPQRLASLNKTFANTMWALPLVGIVTGGLTAGLYLLLLSLALSPILAALLSVGAGLLLTGALHEDGLADTADSFGGIGAEKKLAIMRDSRIGTYGVLALILIIGLRVGLLPALDIKTGSRLVWALIGAAMASRAAMVWLLHTTPPARIDGLSIHAGRPDQRTMAIAVALGTAGLAGGLLLNGAGLSMVLLALALLCLVAYGTRHLCLRMLGGQTGDVCGALQCLSEITVLLVASAAPVLISPVLI